MLFRNKPTPTPPEEPAAPTVSTGAPGAATKGRPTPRRKEAEAARRKPLVPVDRKAAAKSQRAAAKAARDLEYQALQTGDEKHLPLRDKGPVRRFVRDHVDARRNLGEYFLPLSIVVVFALMFVGNNGTAILIVISTLYLALAATIVDSLMLRRTLQRRLTEMFGQVPKGVLMYGILRAFQIRRTRLPRPQVTRGEFPV